MSGCAERSHMQRDSVLRRAFRLCGSCGQQGSKRLMSSPCDKKTAGNSRRATAAGGSPVALGHARLLKRATADEVLIFPAIRRRPLAAGYSPNADRLPRRAGPAYRENFTRPPTITTSARPINSRPAKGVLRALRAELRRIDRPADLRVDDRHVGVGADLERALVDAQDLRRIERHLANRGGPIEMAGLDQLA